MTPELILTQSRQVAKPAICVFALLGDSPATRTNPNVLPRQGMGLALLKEVVYKVQAQSTNPHDPRASSPHYFTWQGVRWEGNHS